MDGNHPILTTPAPDTIRTQDGASLYVRSWGVGAPVLFLHSWAMSGDMWRYQMAHLADRGLRCIAFDRRGHGRSSDPGRGYDYDTLADDVAAVIEGLDLTGVTVVGHSMGCGEAVRYVTRHGAARVKRLALTAPALPFLLKTDDNPVGVEGAALDAVRDLWRRDFDKWMDDNAAPFFTPETSAGTVRWALSMTQAVSLRAAIECNIAVAGTDFREELKRLDVPVLVIQGDRDASGPVEMTGGPTAALIPGARLIVYEAAPHGLFATHIDRLNSDLAAFIEG